MEEKRFEGLIAVSFTANCSRLFFVCENEEKTVKNRKKHKKNKKHGVGLRRLFPNFRRLFMNFRRLSPTTPNPYSEGSFFRYKNVSIGVFLGSNTMSSSATLIRGAEIVRRATMSLEGDAMYLEMLEEKKRLLVPRCKLTSFSK